MSAQTLADGRYHLLEVLGEGGMAKVWCAYDERLQVHRAIKVLLPAFATRSMIRQRFLNEARTMARLHHPNIVAVHDVVEDESRPYMVMELVRGGSLADYLERHGPMHPRLAADATLAVLAALELAHDEGVVHRDIKPQNVLVTAKGKPKVTDFGIARLTGAAESGPALTRTGSTLGTWGFMAPEQRSSAKEVDARADLYAVGATLYALLTNEIPVDLFTAELDDARIAGIPEALEAFIRKACRYHVRDRFEDAREMAEALRAVLPELDELAAATPRLGGSLGELPTPEERREASGGNETLMPALGGETFGIEYSEPPPIVSGGASGPVDKGGTGLTRLDVPEPEARRSPLPWVAGAVVALLLGVLFWPSSEPDPAGAEVEEPVLIGVSEDPVVEVTEVEPPAPVEAPEGAAEGAPPAETAPPPPEAPPAVIRRPPGDGPETRPEEPPPAEQIWGETEAVPEPEVAVSKPPSLGRVVVSGEAAKVVLIAADGTPTGAGEISPGVYTVKASFGEGALAPAGKVTVVAGQTTKVHCDAAFASCRPQ